MGDFFGAIDVVSDLLILFTVTMIALFVILYAALFNPSATSVGRVIFRVMLALFALGGLTVVRGLLPELPEWWPAIRLAVWIYLAISFGTLVWVLLARKFWPNVLRTRPRGDSGAGRLPD